MKLQTIIMLLILTVFIMCSVAQAKECDPGSGDSKWTVYTSGIIIELKGAVCAFNEQDYAMWVAYDKDGNKTYFSGSYVLRSGYHGGSRVAKSRPRNNDQTIGW